MNDLTMEKLVNYCKQYGIIFQGSEIYGGLANTWDYGPLGVEIKENIRKFWWTKFIQENPYNVGIQSAILMNSKVWETSGHINQATDPLMDCKKCQERYRADHLVNDYLKEKEINDKSDAWTKDELYKYIVDNKIKCPKCSSVDWTTIRDFNIMFKTFQGVTEDNKSTVFLRPETAQGMFVNFNNVQRSMRLKIPFGIGQTGKSFRNEITPGNFTFRTREFEQMELEFFCKPGTDIEWFDFYKTFCLNFLLELGIKRESLDFHDHTKEELCHYSKATTDILYKFPFGWDELWGIADRTDYDLNNHANATKIDMSYLDPETNEKYVPFCIEPSLGLDRLILAILCDSYALEELENDTREVLHIHPIIAPYKIAILPLAKKYHSEKAKEIHLKLSKKFMTSYDESGSIGKRYRRQDAIGTYYCLTVDQETLDNGTVTLRNRDTMEQIVISINEVDKIIQETVNI